MTASGTLAAFERGANSARLPTVRDVLFNPLPSLGVADSVLLRAAALVARRQIRGVHGLERVMPLHDPFILALNHNTRLEALLVPALLMHARGGARLHFLADWNFGLIPGVGLLYRRSGVITVTRKAARPRFLNALKPLFGDAMSPMQTARAHLLGGRSIGVFPEGTISRSARNLLRGRFGTARLSLETGVPVVPVGLRYESLAPDAPIAETAPFEIHIGAQLLPPAPAQPLASHAGVKAWHADIMQAISRLSGKSWSLFTEERSDEKQIAHLDRAGGDGSRPPERPRGAAGDLSGREGVGA